MGVVCDTRTRNENYARNFSDKSSRE